LSRDDNPQKQSLARRNKLRRRETHQTTTTTTKDLLVINNNCGGWCRAKAHWSVQKLIGASFLRSNHNNSLAPGLIEISVCTGQVEQEVAALVQPHAFPDLLHAVTRGVAHFSLAIYIKILSKKPKSLKIL
jgi:hypothetical protein